MDKTALYNRLAAERDPALRSGALVRMRKQYPPIKGLAPETVLVCFADKYERVNCTLVGGDPSGRYWRIPAYEVEVIDPATVRPGDLTHR